MDTKLSVALLSGLSLFMSLGAFAVSDDSSDEMNWSYAMGGSTQEANPVSDFDDLMAGVSTSANKPEITCTEGCPARPQKAKPMTLTYEDEAMPLADRVESLPVNRPAPVEDRTPIIIKTPSTAQLDEDYLLPVTDNRSAPVVTREPAPVGNNFSTPAWNKQPMPPIIEPVQNPAPQVETRYVETEPKVQYPITRQYPISVQYPVTVQRNMTVEQPVIMQQPVIVRRPVVMQQDITVRREPTVIQNQPMVMQQQPSFVQQQPLFLQAPAAPMSPETLSSINSMMPQPQIQIPPAQIPMPQPQLPQAQLPQAPVQMPQMSAPMTDMPAPYPMQPTYMPFTGMPQQYQVQGQIQAQPVYAMPPMYAPAPMTPAPVAQAPQQPAYTPAY